MRVKRLVKAAILPLLIMSQPAIAQIDFVDINAVYTDSNVVLADLEALSDTDKRRLDFYAGKVISEIRNIASAELEGNGQNTQRSVNTAHEMAVRFKESALGMGLTDREATQYFLSGFTSEYNGPLPNALLNESGNFDLNSLFVKLESEGDVTGNNGSGYIDLLLDESAIGGVD